MGESRVLKDLYRDYFRIGVACEPINERFKNNEIGNPDKEALMAREFNSMTFGNQLKPMYNMGFKSPDAREDFLPFVLNPEAETMLNWCKANNMPVRGHVMVWHSQCPKEVFCKNYEAVTFPTDPELLKENPHLKFFEKLNPVCFVDRDTMLARLKSYIFNLVEWMYRDGWQEVIYAWDVVNEAIELQDKTETGVRKSYWTDVIGPDYIYWSFRFARDAVDTMQAKYGGRKPLLFYNDYNEFEPKKKEAIIANLKRETEEHGSVIGEGLLDGIGMQGHLSDNNNIDDYYKALMEYSKLAAEVHITELDVKCTCTNKNAEYYQAVFYKSLFEMLIKAKKEGAHLSCVTFWGLTDDNSWIRGANPLLFHGDLTTKKAYDALMYAISGESLGEPEVIEIDLSDRHYRFDDSEGAPCDYKALGFKARGFGELTVVDSPKGAESDSTDATGVADHHTGTKVLAAERRFGPWSGISLDVSDFIGQTVRIRAKVYSPALKVRLCAEKAASGDDSDIIGAGECNGAWAEISAEYRVPFDVHSMVLFFDTEEQNQGKFSPIYVESMDIELVGLKESFEGPSHIGAIRGMGHLPFLMVTDKESVDGRSKSLRVTRQEKDATVKFDISSYIGRSIGIEMYVKTKDSKIRIGLDGATPIIFSEYDSENGFTKLCAEASIDRSLKSAEIFVETNGNSDMFIDDIFVYLL